MKKWVFALGAAALAASAPVAAWNGRGHMIVAAKAWEHLTPSTRNRVGQLLHHNPMYASWIEGVSDADRDRVAFIHAATWPDAIKSPSSGYTSDRITGPNANRNTGYDDCQQHRFWHFKDLPFSPDGTALQTAPTPNLETRVSAFTTVLGDSNAGDERKAYDLVWLIHLVGDAHQPLHATSRFIATDLDGDGGGNDVLVCNSAGCRGTPLHTFWDHIFGDSENIATITTFAGGLPDPNAAQAADLTPSTWLNESFLLAQSQVYQGPIGVGLGPFTLTSGYRPNALNVATGRVALAGVRLANLIETAGITVHGEPVQARRCVGGRSV